MSSIQKLDFLLAFYIMAVVWSELVGGKTFTAFGLNASVAIFMYPLTFAINDIVTEVYGKERARSFVKSTFIMLLLLVAFTALALSLPPSTRYLATNKAFVSIFMQSQRITLASLAAFWLSEQFDIYVFSRIRKMLGTKRLWLRSNVSNIVGQFVDTTLFMFLAFFVPGNMGFVVSLIIPYWGLKCFMSFVETPITYLGVTWLKKSS